MTLPTSSRARRRQNVLLWVSFALLPLSCVVGLFVGNDWIPFSP